jgi:hypothetical protein
MAAMAAKPAKPGAVLFLAVLTPLACRPLRPIMSDAQFHGWPAKVLRNAAAEVTVVPAIGRVMQFRLLEAGSKPIFWGHPALGPALAPDENGWINFGGDKAWPAPQSAWAGLVGKGWPPPRTFDAVAHAATVEKECELVLTSPVDPAYGMRVRRKISVCATDPVMTIETTYEKVSGAKVQVSVWTIAQLISPARAFVLLPKRSAFPDGYRSLLPAAPKELALNGRLLSLARDTAQKTMIATDGDALLWVGDGPDLLIENRTPARAGVQEKSEERWPEGTHSQIYTSSDDAESYVELELLGPLHDLEPGQSATLTSRYTLIPRGEADPLAEAQRVFESSL